MNDDFARCQIATHRHRVISEEKTDAVKRLDHLG